MVNAHKFLSQQLQNVPAKLTEAIVARKLRAAGLANADEIAPKLIEHTLSGNAEKFIWSDADERSRDIVISITEADVAEVKSQFNDFLRNDFPKVIADVSEASSDDLLDALKDQWPEQLAWNQATTSNFRDSLDTRWNKGLNLLRMLLSICLEIGAENFERHQLSKRRKASHLSEVIVRLHARACQVSGEILTLMESGFADGAMARWRTLHEIGVVATFISDFGEETAKRYVAHQLVEAKAGMDEYSRSNTSLGYKPLSKRATTKIDSDYRVALEEYGKEFASPFGWAAKDLKKKKPIFSDLEAAAGRAWMRTYYKMASYNVHASARGIFFRHSTLDPAILIAGASNAGLTEPGQNLAVTLTLVTTLLFGPNWKFEDIVALKVITKIRDEIPDALFRAERKLQRDEAARQKRQAKSKKTRQTRQPAGRTSKA